MKKRKLASIFIASAIFATTFVCSLYPSAADEDFKVSLVEVPVDVGIDANGNQPDEMPFMIEIRMDNIPTGGLSAVQFAIEFDDSIITFDADGDNKVDDYTEGDLSDNGAYEKEQSYGSFDNSGSSLALSVNDNQLNVVWSTGLLTKDSAYYLNGSGVLATISGTYSKNASSPSLNIVPVTAYNLSGEEIDIMDFSVWVDDDSNIFKSYSPVLVNLDLFTGGGTAIDYGDIDCDGKVAGITDVILLSKHVSKKLSLPATSKHYINSNCYLKGDSANAVDVLDLKAVIDVLLGSIATLPVK
jgi:hypothetical protein